MERPRHGALRSDGATHLNFPLDGLGNVPFLEPTHLQIKKVSECFCIKVDSVDVPFPI